MAKLSEVEGLQEALAEARAAGAKEGETKGYAAGRADASAIMCSAAAKNAPDLAAKFAGDASITPEAAAVYLDAAPKAATTGPAFQKMLTDKAPDVGPNTPPADAEKARADRIAQLQGIGKSTGAAR